MQQLLYKCSTLVLPFYLNRPKDPVTMDWYNIVFVKSSKNKKAILKALLAAPMTPAELAKKLNNHRSTISQNLIEMKKRELVVCLTPKNKNYRLYRITKKGKDVLQRIN